MTGKGLPKRGKEGEDFAKEGKRKGRNDSLDYTKSQEKNRGAGITSIKTLEE